MSILRDYAKQNKLFDSKDLESWIYFIANIEVNAASFDKIGKLLDFLYLIRKK